jgi:hypothetical protein
MTRNESAHQLTLNELLRREGRSFEAIAEAVMFGMKTHQLSAPKVAKSNQMELANMASLPCSAPQG